MELKETKIAIKVTKIGQRYHARLLQDDGTILDEMACRNRLDIGWICREMLRWFDKNGGYSKFAMMSRKRQRNATPTDKVWYYNALKYYNK